MFSVITNIYNENQRTYLNGIVHSHRKTEKGFFLQLEIFGVCTTGDIAHIDTIFKFLPHTRHHGECDNNSFYGFVSFSFYVFLLYIRAQIIKGGSFSFVGQSP
jgi:hypothetical protein